MALRLRMVEAVESVRSSYWFVPGLLALAGLGAGVGLVYLDGWVGDPWLGQFEWFIGSRPEGARAVLSTIASSTITVAGVVFSVTLAAVTYASGQHGPRLLTAFQKDRGNQATLGVFIATFLYCLVVLRTIRSAAEASADTAGAVREAFVPHLATYGAFGLTLLSIGMLVYFVHHVTDSIHINNVIARIGEDLIAEIRCLPEAESADAPAMPVVEPGTPVTVQRAGYVLAVDRTELVAIACREDQLLVLACRAGDFVWPGRQVLSARGDLSDTALRKIRAAFAIGPRRTTLQDPGFRMDELVEIAGRALSPGVNDPFTAMACLDWLGAACAEMARRAPPAACWRDEAGEVRLVERPISLAGLMDDSLEKLHPYVSRDPNARAHAVALMEALLKGDPPPDMRGVLSRRLRQLQDG